MCIYKIYTYVYINIYVYDVYVHIYMYSMYIYIYIYVCTYKQCALPTIITVTLWQVFVATNALVHLMSGCTLHCWYH